MHFLADYFPLILFFVAFKLAGIYVATAVAIAASVIQIAYFRWHKGRVATIACNSGRAATSSPNRLRMEARPSACAGSRPGSTAATSAIATPSARASCKPVDPDVGADPYRAEVCARWKRGIRCVATATIMLGIL